MSSSIERHFILSPPNQQLWCLALTKSFSHSYCKRVVKYIPCMYDDFMYMYAFVLWNARLKLFIHTCTSCIRCFISLLLMSADSGGIVLSF